MRLSTGLVLAALLAGCGFEPPSQGVSLELAEQRRASISNLEYRLHLVVPADSEAPIDGEMSIQFDHTGGRQLVVDFVPNTVASVSLNDAPTSYVHVNEHLVVESGDLKPTDNQLTIAFTAGDASLNRNDDYLYALFVPDRARMALPVFDQPNLKARWSLTLDVPGDWTALSNGRAHNVEKLDNGRRFHFARTQPISTYLFTFVVGDFESVTSEVGGRSMTMYHRESDSVKVARNAPEIFQLHGQALAWLEDYTGIEYPFGKFDFALIPSFQFGGMEHPGAIHYRSSSLMLDENAPQARQLGRASLIAHETAHMWFGDLVTMDWFNDVWTKEVFANFMAAKIVEPSFPEVDHELRFLMAHYPSAYGVDRTAGANPIRQRLDNLNDAGSLYGAIIYQKAPIVMRKLEVLLGRDAFRDGMREYLSQFSFANATWPDLVAILDARSEQDLTAWSSAWVDEPGRPDLTITVSDGVLGLQESDSRGRGLSWPQDHRFLIGGTAQDDASLVYGTRSPDGHALAVSEAGPGSQLPDGTRFILPNHLGQGYGAFHVPTPYLVGLLESIQGLAEPVNRGAAWITLWEAVFNGELDPDLFQRHAQAAILSESNQLVRDRVSSYVRQAYWRFLSPEDRLLRAAQIEELYQTAMENAPTAAEKLAFFKAWMDVVLTPEGVRRLEAVWDGSIDAGVTLSEWDRAEIAAELALRGVSQSDEVLRSQLEQLEDPDRRERFEALLEPLSSSAEVRSAWFASLSALENRSNESRVLEGVRYLNHPLRARQSADMVRPALELALEIQETGDIFFPGRWLDAVLGGHQTQTVLSMVEEFLETRPPDYPERLRGKVLQSADGLKRAVRISDQ